MSFIFLEKKPLQNGVLWRQSLLKYTNFSLIVRLFLSLFRFRYALFLSRWYVIFVLIGVPLVFIGLGVYSVVLNVPDFTNPTKVS